jgi:hypothetical protein
MANKEQKGNANTKKEPKMTLKEKRAAKATKEKQEQWLIHILQLLA